MFTALPLLLPLLVACNGSKNKGDTGLTDSGGGGDSGTTADGGGAGDTAPAPPDPTVDLSGPNVIDPFRTGPLDFALAGTDIPDGATVTMVLTPAPTKGDTGSNDTGLGDAGSSAPAHFTSGDTGAVPASAPFTLASGLAAGTDFSWDGHAPDGAPVASGAWTLEADLVDAKGALLVLDQQTIYVVRTGVIQGRFGVVGGADDQRIPLLWYRASGASPYWDDAGAENTFATSGVTQGSGFGETLLPVPEVWPDLAAPPTSSVDVNMPAAYAWDSRPTLGLTLADLGPAAGAATWTAELDGWELVDGDPASGNLTFRKVDPLADGPSVVEGDLQLRLMADGQLIGTESIPYRLYATMGPPTFASSASPNMLWTAAADQALRGITGVEPDETAVLNALVAWVYDEADLAYDTRSGASFYTGYYGSWSGGRINMRSFLDRSNGRIVNCSDCAGIMGAFANMLGVPLDYSIILSNFGLNEIKAIGIDDFTSCPFGPTSCGFSYHAVTTDDRSSHIWDATLDLDGDDDPGSEPWDELRVQEVPGDEYLDRLVRSGSAAYYYDNSRIQIQ